MRDHNDESSIDIPSHNNSSTDESSIDSPPNNNSTNTSRQSLEETTDNLTDVLTRNHCLIHRLYIPDTPANYLGMTPFIVLIYHTTTNSIIAYSANPHENQQFPFSIGSLYGHYNFNIRYDADADVNYLRFFNNEETLDLDVFNNFLGLIQRIDQEHREQITDILVDINDNARIIYNTNHADYTMEELVNSLPDHLFFTLSTTATTNNYYYNNYDGNTISQFQYITYYNTVSANNCHFDFFCSQQTLTTVTATTQYYYSLLLPPQNMTEQHNPTLFAMDSSHTISDYQ